MNDKKLLTPIEWLQSIKEMKNEQTIKVAARSLFRNRLHRATKRKKAMSKKLTAVEWLAEQMLHPEIHNPYIEQALKMEKEQTIKAAARGFLAMPEKFNLNDAKEFAEQYYKNTYERKNNRKTNERKFNVIK
jgi:hypothetical protein